MNQPLASQTSLRLVQLLVDLQPGAHAQESGPDIETVVRVANSLSKISNLQSLNGNSR